MEKALRFVLFMGLVSLLGDVVYEGARSVLGAYLATFGITAALLGLVIGLGELISYGFRLVSGYFADKTRSYWALTFLGYALILSIPMIALTNSLALIISLILLERLGKALRSPARDTLLSFATAKMGRGKGFGIHEALDQIGAFLGPLIFFLVVFMGYGYREGFALLFIPGILMLVFLYTARQSYVGEEVEKEAEGKLGRKFWLYIAFTTLAISGLVNFQLIAYHFKLNSIFSDELIPVLYAFAMGVDALSALIVGKAYDKLGLKCLFLVPVLTPLSVAFSLGENPMLGLILFGAILGIQESVMRAGAAEFSSVGKRATAYGVLNTSFGVGFFAGSLCMGLLYDISTAYLILFSLAVEIVALAFLILILRSK